MATHARLDWDAEADASRRSWRIYRSKNPDARGDLVAEVNGTDRAYIDRNIGPGTWYWRVLAISLTGTEEDWRQYRQFGKKTVSYQPDKVPAIPVVGGGLANLQVAAAFVAAANAGNQAVKIQVIKGTDPETGQLVSETEVKSGKVGTDATPTQTYVGAAITPGNAAGAATYTLRFVSAQGATGGSYSTVTIPQTVIPNHNLTDQIATVVGGTWTNLATPTTSQPYEKVTGVGIRLRAIPTGASATDALGWGHPSHGLLSGYPSGARYVTGATIAFTPYDAGVQVEGLLECHDEFRRSSTHAFQSIQSRRMSLWKNVEDNPEAFETDLDCSWAPLLHRSDGKPMRPASRVRWQIRVSNTSQTAGSWQEYAPMMLIRGRYISARMLVSEPMGLSQLQCYRAHVKLWKPWSGDEVPLANLPTGPSGTSVALGNHVHDGYHQRIAYGSLIVAENATNFTVSTTPAKFVPWSAVGVTANVSASTTTGLITTAVTGVFEIKCSMSFSGTPSADYKGILRVNGAEQNERWERTLSGGEIGVVSFFAQKSVTTGASFAVYIEADGSNKAFTMEQGQFLVTRIN